MLIEFIKSDYEKSNTIFFSPFSPSASFKRPLKSLPFFEVKPSITEVCPSESNSFAFDKDIARLQIYAPNRNLQPSLYPVHP